MLEKIDILNICVQEYDTNKLRTCWLAPARASTRNGVIWILKYFSKHACIEWIQMGASKILKVKHHRSALLFSHFRGCHTRSYYAQKKCKNKLHLKCMCFGIFLELRNKINLISLLMWEHIHQGQFLAF